MIIVITYVKQLYMYLVDNKKRVSTYVHNNKIGKKDLLFISSPNRLSSNQIIKNQI